MSMFRRNTSESADQPAAQPAAQHNAADIGSAAISLDKVQQAAPGLVSLYKQARVSLEKRGLAGQRAAVYLVLDRSGSMRSYYEARRGQVSRMQYFAEQALGLSANLDDDGTVPLIFFDNRAYRPVDLNLTDYQGRIGDEHQRLGLMGGTDYAAAMRTVIAHYQASGATDPAFVIFQTDGCTRDENAVKDLLKESSNLPIYWMFVGFGTPGSSEFKFLRSLDNLRGRAVDNAGFMEAGRDPSALSDTAMYDQLTAELPTWLADIAAKGIRR